MNYIGSKLKLIDYIKETIIKYCGRDLSDKVFCDIFAGTGVVGKSFAPYVKKIIANDLELYSYIANYVSLNGYNMDTAEKHIREMNMMPPDYGCKFAQYYAEGGSSGRLFYSKENGAKIGAARNYVESLYLSKKIQTDVYYTLILSIINASDSVANYTGIYSAFLKKIKPSAQKPVVFKLPETNGFQCESEIYNENANSLIKKIKGDILYLDPPYNTRQYGSNYHIFNNIAKNQYPETDSISGVDKYNKSKYSSKRDAADELDNLLKNADFEWIFLSYNNEGIIPFKDIGKIMGKYGDYFVEEKEHHRYKADNSRRNLAGTDKTIEYIHVLHKKVESPNTPQENNREMKLSKISTSKIKNVIGGGNIVSPMNYMGGKKKLVASILKYVPKDVDTFIDLFCGGCTVGINADAKKIIFNDCIADMISLYSYFKAHSSEDILEYVENTIKKYGLSKTNEKGYLDLRAHYNSGEKNPLDLFCLAAHSFNNQIRFNSKNEFNMPFGRDRSDFNEVMKKHLIEFLDALHRKDVAFFSGDFADFEKRYKIGENDFVYCDPPYLVSVATYNMAWDESKERQLLAMLSDLNKRGIRFALSNVLENKGEENTILKKWAEENNFNVIHFDKDYSNCSYHRTKKETKSDEVLIVNYNIEQTSEKEMNLFSEIEEKEFNDNVESNKNIDKIELNNIYNCDCIEGLKQMEDNSVDLTVTSCPYDNLRKYTDEDKGECEWNFETFKPIAKELARVTKKGGVIVWNVGDAVVNGSETGSSFRQALYFMEECGLKLHDTMIYEKNSSSFPARIDGKRYTQIFEYMFVFTKGKIRNDISLIADKRNKWAGWTNWGQHSQYNAEGKLQKTKNIKPIAEFSLRTNIWKYSVSFNDKTGHPAVFPEKLAEDHILSWTNEGDIVLDPFMGSGTTAKMAMINKRNYIGFERNTEYYIESLKRVGKYEGKYNENVSEITIDNEYLQVNTEDDKEEKGKTELWNKLIEELNQYFNEQSLGILKNLRLTFTSKSNDKRVEKVLQEDGISEPEYLEPIVENNNPTVEEIAEYEKLMSTDKKKQNLPTFEDGVCDLPLVTEKRVREIFHEEFDRLFDLKDVVASAAQPQFKDLPLLSFFKKTMEPYISPLIKEKSLPPMPPEIDIPDEDELPQGIMHYMDYDYNKTKLLADGRKRRRRSIKIGDNAVWTLNDLVVTIRDKKYIENDNTWDYTIETENGNIICHVMSNELIAPRVKKNNADENE